MGEYVELLRRMAHTRLGETLTYSGQVHHMQWSPAVDPGARPYPIVLAAVFPSMLAIAARVADGIGGGATLSVEYLRDVVRPRVARDAAGARRPLPRFYAVGLLALDSDRERARHAARAAIAHFYAPLPHPYYDYTLREQGFSAAADACLECVPAGRVAAALAAIPDELVDHLTIAGTFDDCVARVRAYAGVVDELLLLNVMPPTSTSVVAGYHALMQLPRHLASSA
jgi:alkanesulfonate monooxygenase SsuD/methylene tetrahydromethanopterin reductase-like flavin-dependent oxidoreductase (luciferase family)